MDTMTTWSKSNISIEGTRVPNIEELYEGMEVLMLVAGEYDASNEMNFFPYTLTSKDIEEFKAYDGNIMYGKGTPLDFIRINK